VDLMRVRHHRSLGPAVLLVALLFPQPLAWGQDWKNAYLKGIEHLDAGRWAEAVQLFDLAIGANPREDRSVRLYGMRYGYFPHRDRGVALFRAEQWEAAVPALQESVRQGVSPDAARYLELARQGQPAVELPHVFRGTWWDHYERGLLYAERARWRQAIDDFRAARQAHDHEAREARTYGVRFIDYFPNRELGVALYHDGQYKSALEALDRSLAKLPTAKAAYYHNLARAALLRQSAPDKQPPRIRIEAPANGLITNSLTLEVRGIAESRNLIGTLLVNGETEVIEVAPASMPFATVVSLVPGPNLVEVIARDLVAQESRATVNVVVDREGPVVVLDRLVRAAGDGLRLEGTVYDNVRLSSLQINTQPVVLSGTTQSAFAWEKTQGAPDALLIEAADAAGNVTRVRLPTPAELRRPGAYRQPPVVPVAWSPPVVPVIFHHKREPLAIEVEQPPAEVQQETIPISWIVMATSPLASVKINGEMKTLRQAEAGKPSLFSHSLALAEGENVVTITAADRTGRTISKQVRLVRKAEEIDGIGSRLTVAVLPFQHKGKPSDLYEGAYDAMVDGLVNQRRFKIVSRAELDSILKELKLSATELVDQATAVRVGRVVAAEAIMVGTVVETGTSAEVYVKLMNTETSTLLVAKDVFDPAKSAGSSRAKMQELATKVRQDYPVVSGPVVSVVNGRLAVALGSQRKVRPDMRVLVYVEGTPLIDPQTKVVLDRNIEPVGEGLLSEVRPQVSFAVVKSDALGKAERFVTQKKTVKVITK
jgi:hypothetical protein